MVVSIHAYIYIFISGTRNLIEEFLTYHNHPPTSTTKTFTYLMTTITSTTTKKVSASPYEHMLGKPDVKYIGGIHGNEAVGRELLLHLIQYFVTNYHTDPYIKWLLDNTRIHILPSLNVSFIKFRQKDFFFLFFKKKKKKLLKML